LSVICRGEVLCESIIEEGIVVKTLNFSRKLYVEVFKCNSIPWNFYPDENFGIIILELGYRGNATEQLPVSGAHQRPKGPMPEFDLLCLRLNFTF
jgi:hypothetical protein